MFVHYEKEKKLNGNDTETGVNTAILLSALYNRHTVPSSNINQAGKGLQPPSVGERGGGMPPA